MYHHEYKLELKVTAIVDNYHREAIQAEQRRLDRAGRPGRIATAAMRLRTSVRSLFTTAGAHVRQERVARPELANVPSDTALIA